jgi:hypothetical protein
MQAKADPGQFDAQVRFQKGADMARKKTAQKQKKRQTKTDSLGSLERLGGKKLIQHGAEESLHGKGSRQHSVGGNRG